VAFALLGPPHASQAWAADPTLSELIARFTDHATASDSLLIHFERRLVPGGIHSEPAYPVEHWTWYRHGEKCLITSQPFRYPSARIPARIWECYDGQHWTWLSFVAPDMARPMEFASNDESSRMAWLWSAAYFEWIVGNRINWLGRPLFKELHVGHPRFTGRTRVQGKDCFQIESDEFQTLPPSSPHRFRVDLDPEADFFPRRIEVHPVAWWKHGDWLKYETGTNVKLEVLEYETAFDALAGRQRHFPKRMHCQEIWAQTELEAQTIRCNEPIADEIFRPALPAGVLVREHFGTHRQSESITGGEAGRLLYEEFNREHRKALGLDADSVDAKAPMAENPVDARPANDTYYGPLAVAAGAACLIGALVAAFRARR